MKYRIIYLVVFLFCNVITAQNCKIKFSGKVEDFHENLPLENAVILIKELNKYATTDDKGFFKFKNLCEGNFTIEISHISCGTKTIKVSFTKDVYKTIHLEHHIKDLDEIKINSQNTSSSTKQATTIKKDLIDSYSSGS